MKLDCLLVVGSLGWLVLVLAVFSGVNAKPLEAGSLSRPRRAYHQPDWMRGQSFRTVPDFMLGALEQLHHREKRFPRVPMGIQCKADVNCPDDHCCAMKLGKAVCLPKLTRGRTCMVNAPRAYSPHLLFTQCPCNSNHGLSCERRASGNRGVCSAQSPTHG